MQIWMIEAGNVHSDELAWANAIEKPINLSIGLAKPTQGTKPSRFGAGKEH